jgi:hypothetical protein
MARWSGASAARALAVWAAGRNKRVAIEDAATQAVHRTAPSLPSPA